MGGRFLVREKDLTSLLNYDKLWKSANEGRSYMETLVWREFKDAILDVVVNTYETPIGKLATPKNSVLLSTQVVSRDEAVRLLRGAVA
jgi:hypothetical protein